MYACMVLAHIRLYPIRTTDAKVADYPQRVNHRIKSNQYMVWSYTPVNLPTCRKGLLYMYTGRHTIDPVDSDTSIR